jgi:hypothetical protein
VGSSRGQRFSSKSQVQAKNGESVHFLQTYEPLSMNTLKCFKIFVTVVSPVNMHCPLIASFASFRYY